MNKKTKKTKKNTCKTCLGFGLWNDDTDQPMGPIDASDGLTTKACPECKKNANPQGKKLKPNENFESFVVSLMKNYDKKNGFLFTGLKKRKKHE